MIYCLDTNVIVRALRGKNADGISEKLSSERPENIKISEMVRAELLVGVGKSARPNENRRLLNQFLAPFQHAPFEGDAVEHYADIRVTLEQSGDSIGPNDLVIAATARAIGGDHGHKQSSRISESSRSSLRGLVNQRRVIRLLSEAPLEQLGNSMFDVPAHRSSLPDAVESLVTADEDLALADCGAGRDGFIESVLGNDFKLFSRSNERCHASVGQAIHDAICQNG